MELFCVCRKCCVYIAASGWTSLEKVVQCDGMFADFPQCNSLPVGLNCQYVTAVMCHDGHVVV